MRSLLPVPLPVSASPPAAGSVAGARSGTPTPFSPRPPADPDAGIPVTMHPGQDIHLARARPLGELRAELAACTGRPELTHAPIYVDDRRLDDHHVVGHPPLLAGAVLRTTPSPCPTPERALAAPAHLAVLTGRRAGELLPLQAGEPVDAFGVRVRVGRRGRVSVAMSRDRPDRPSRRPGSPGGRVGGRQRLDRRRRLDPYCRRRVSLTGPTGRVRVIGRRGRGTPWTQRSRWRPSRWRRWKLGWLLTVEEGAGRTTLTTIATVERRDRPVLADRTYAALLAALEPSARTSSPDDGARPTAGVMVAGLVPAVVSIMLAIVLRNPIFALMALTAPLMILGPILARRRRGRPGAGTAGGALSATRSPRRGAPRDPGGLASWESPWGRGAFRAGLPPADLLTAAAACAALPAGEAPGVASGSPGQAGQAGWAGQAGSPGMSGMLPGSGAPGASGWPEGATPVPGDLPDGCLAVVGQRAAGAALAARMLVSLHACGRGQTVTILCDASRVAAWEWARWLPHTRILAPSSSLVLEAGPGRLLVVDCHQLGPLVARLGAWHARHPGHAATLLVVGDAASVPSWCAARATVEHDTGTRAGNVAGDGDGDGDRTTGSWDGGDGAWRARVVWSAPGTATETTPFDGVTADWLDSYARRVAALDQRGRWTHVARTVPGLPDGARLPGDTSGHPTDTPGNGSVGRSPDDPLGIPRRTALSEVPGIWEVERHWQENARGPGPTGPAGDRIRARDTLEARIGVGQGGAAVTIDLLSDGPHALVAGTTGAGKSELLQTLVLSLALAHSPDDLAVALVDYKGGASFGECARLPHVVGQVTDLDPGAAERALTGLRAELRRRERLFAAVGAGDLATYRLRREDAESLPRLLVVVDEFRAMADDHPDFIPGLVRIAAQGRSLGIHLVLATQRPSGAITGDMRANISLRIALRVAGTADSQDVIDVPDAAWIPAHLPGRAIVRRGLGPPEVIQTYFAGGHSGLACPGVWHSPNGVSIVGVRAGMEAGVESGTGSGTGAGARSDAVRSLVGRVALADLARSRGADPTVIDPVAALVDVAVQAATRLGIARPHVPWTPPLPSQIGWDDLDGADLPATTLVLGLADHPEDQRQRPVGWAPSEGHLLVLGRAGSGRTSALRTLAHAALASGRTVHLLGPAALTAGFTRADPRLGTVADLSDARRVARLLTVLAAGRRAAPAGLVQHVVVVDGLEDMLPAVSQLRRGAGLDLFLSALREGQARGIAFVLSGAALPSSQIAASVRHRLVLGGATKHDDVFLGIPTALAGLGGTPGRAVLTGPTPLLCQVAIATVRDVAAVRDVGTVRDVRTAGTAEVGPGSATGGEMVTTPTAEGAGHVPGTSDGPGWPRIEDVPFLAQVPAAAAPGPGLVLLGLGGDEAVPLWVRTGQSFLVCGPHGSGRTTALVRLLDVAPAVGAPGESGILGVVSRDARLTDRAMAWGGVPVLSRLTPVAGARFVEEVRAVLSSRTHSSPPLRLVIDDLDTFAGSCPLALDALCERVDGDAGGDEPPQVSVLASATTLAAAGAFRGLLADLRAARYGLVLSPGAQGSSEVFGADLGWHVEPESRSPGRGVLVDGSGATFVQVVDVPQEAAPPGEHVVGQVPGTHGAWPR